MVQDKNEVLTRKWFHERAHDYKVHIVEGQPSLYANVGPVLNRQVRGRTLVVGCGPMLHFAIPKDQAATSVCLDLAEAPLSRLKREETSQHLEAVCADAGRLPFGEGEFDTVVLPFIFHHIAQISVAATLQKAQDILGEAARVAGPGNRVVVLDLFLNGIFYTLQRTFYGPTRAFINALGQPMMFFQNNDTLGHPSLLRLSSERVPLPDRIVPTLLIPRFQIPGKFHPAEIHCLVLEVKR